MEHSLHVIYRISIFVFFFFFSFEFIIIIIIIIIILLYFIYLFIFLFILLNAKKDWHINYKDLEIGFESHQSFLDLIKIK